MKTKSVNAGVKAVLEFGPTIGFVLAYLIFRNDTVLIGGTAYSGLVAVIAAFIPVFALAIALLWYLSGSLAPVQVATAVMVILFGGVSVWLNDPRLFKMKPTAIYGLLAIMLVVGLMRGKFWLKYLIEDMLPMERAGWRILTKRVIVLFVLSAAANEVVWRTQTETFWVIFETFVMPVIVIGFFLAQIGLFVDHAAINPSKKKR